MVKAELNQDMIATVAGDVTVYNYDGETREYLSSSVEYLPVGVGIPANSCIDAPGESKTGFAICRTADLSSWEYITDHRGQTVYSTETMQQVEVT
ncbi:tail fiber assembly protein, partial [Citrobacter freundii]